MFRKLSAELIGTFWLVFGGCGSAVLAAGFPDVGIGFAGVALAFGLTVLTMTGWRHLGSGRLRESMRSWVRTGLVVFAAVLAATYLANLVPWWRSAWPSAALVVVTAAWTGLLGVAAVAGRWRRTPVGPVAAVAAMTFIVLAADVMTGSRLQLSSLLGLNPIVGGRYFGLGNVAFALFAAATFLLAIVASDRLVRAGHQKLAALTVAAIGVVAVVVIASPSWGDKVGGPRPWSPGWPCSSCPFSRFVCAGQRSS